MPDTAALNITNINIDSLEAEDTQRDNCNTNTDGAKISNAKQEIHGARKYCTNMDGILQNSNNNSEPAANNNAKHTNKLLPVMSKCCNRQKEKC